MKTCFTIVLALSISTFPQKKYAYFPPAFHPNFEPQHNEWLGGGTNPKLSPHHRYIAFLEWPETKRIRLPVVKGYFHSANNTHDLLYQPVIHIEKPRLRHLGVQGVQSCQKYRW
jgi:hypothetical protein